MTSATILPASKETTRSMKGSRDTEIMLSAGSNHEAIQDAINSLLLCVAMTTVMPEFLK